MSGSSRALMEARRLIRERLHHLAMPLINADLYASVAVEAISRSDELCLVIHRKKRKPT